MATKKPTDIYSAYAQSIAGVTYTKDQRLTAANLATIDHLDALLSKGKLYLVPDRHGRKPSRNYVRPSHLSGKEIAAYS